MGPERDRSPVETLKVRKLSSFYHLLCQFFSYIIPMASRPALLKTAPGGVSQFLNMI